LFLRDYILELELQLMVLDQLWHLVKESIKTPPALDDFDPVDAVVDALVALLNTWPALALDAEDALTAALES